jgi:small subunit ribosomal protein S20
MPNIKSVKKDVLRSRERQLRNQAAKSQIKTLIKKARVAIDGHATAETVKPLVATAASAIDRAFKRGIIHRNAAARRKSRLAKRLNDLTTS